MDVFIWAVHMLNEGPKITAGFLGDTPSKFGVSLRRRVLTNP
jgi:hypothetical protein